MFGPVVRDHSHELTKKFRKLGLKTALSAKAKEGNLVIIDEAKLSTPKTKDLKAKLSGKSQTQQKKPQVQIGKVNSMLKQILKKGR